MKRKVIWLVMSGLLVLSLVLASCAPAVTEKKEVVTPPTEKKEVVTPPTEKKEVAPAGPQMVKLNLKKLDGTVVEKMVEEPRYGGTITCISATDPMGFDPTNAQQSTMRPLKLVNETLQTGDWSRSPVGTNEYTFTHGHYIPMKMRMGCLAESWEQPDPLTVIWHIRKGIHWQNVPPVNGRELTAADIAYANNRQRTPPSLVADKFWGMVDTIEATDKYTVVEKLKWPDYYHIEQIGDSSVAVVYAPEVVQKYGGLTDWKSAIGTGPWIITDYVRGSVISFKKNSDYWMNDPLFPENTLPYADNVQILIIPDPSTQMAALASGKLDVLNDQGWMVMDTLKKTNPEISYRAYQYSGGSISIAFRVDEPPFNDIRVRQALTIAIDQESVVKNYLGGYGELHNWPMMRDWGEDVWTPIDKLPTEPTLPGSRCSVRELYTYNPEKAKQLLVEAGYPKGFTFNCYLETIETDVVSLVKAYWDKIGVNVQLQVLDTAVKAKMARTIPRTFHGAMRQEVQASYPLGVWTGSLGTLGSMNVGNISDPRIDKTFLDMCAEPDQNEARKMCKDLAVYTIENAYKIAGPHATYFNFWQPWIKNCEGASVIGYFGQYQGLNYYWVDQNLKEELTGRR